MARPIEYDKELVLSRAMETFWRLGYEATSMKDLIEATGMTSRSMYNTFDSKNGLFKAALNWYYEINVRKPYEKLIKEEGITAIKNFIMTIASYERPNGCFYGNTVSDRNSINKDCLAIVDKYFDDLEAVFKSKLIYAQEYDGYKGEPGLRAKELLVMLHGLSVFSKKIDSVKNRELIAKDFLALMGI
jgi:TetR/AcrR family transcriptional repressor of nem operon